MTLQDREKDHTFDNCQTDFRHRREWRLSEQRNLLNCDVQVSQLDLLTEGGTGKQLLANAELRLFKGRHYGLVGRNGVGKSTLMKMIASHRIHGMWRHLRCLCVNDNLISEARTQSDRTAIESLLASYQERTELCEKLAKELEKSEEIEEGGPVPNTDLLDAVYQQLKLIGGDSAESRGRQILNGLGIAPDVHIGQLSGGMLHRLALATALFVEADILLLDEPTNHLDIIAQRWLQEFLRKTSSTVILVTHDSVFLDEVVDHIICMEDQQLKYYDGNYSKFLETRAELFRKQKRMYISQENRRRRLLRTIENLTAREQQGDESRSRQIHGRKQELIFRLGKSMDGVYWKYGLMGPRPEILAPVEEEPFDFEIETDVSDVPIDDGPKDDSKRGNELMITRDLGFTWDGVRVLFDRVSLRIGLGSRLVFLGHNASGKTTLLRCLTGELTPKRGSILRWEGLRIGYFEQDAVAHFPVSCGDLTALQFLMKQHKLSGVKGEKKARRVLFGFGLSGIMAEEQPIGTLSSGQRARVLLANCTVHEPHILFLDEPTNHLDQESTAALISALQAFDGGVVLSTHDQYLAESVGEEFYAFPPQAIAGKGASGELIPMKDFDEYLNLVLKISPEVPLHRASGKGEVPQLPSAADEQKVSPSISPKVAPMPPHPSTQLAALPVPKGVDPAHAGTVVCRHCQGPHFSHSCPQPKPQPEPTAVAKSAPPPLKVKADDGGGDWKVAVSKNTMRQLQKAKKQQSK